MSKAFETLLHWKICFPTLAFLYVVDHTRRITNVSEPFYGRTHDKTITANDSFPVRLSPGRYRDVEYVLYDKGVMPNLCKEVYFIVDGGYPKTFIPHVSAMISFHN